MSKTRKHKAKIYPLLGLSKKDNPSIFNVKYDILRPAIKIYHHIPRVGFGYIEGQKTFMEILKADGGLRRKNKTEEEIYAAVKAIEEKPFARAGLAPYINWFSNNTLIEPAEKELRCYLLEQAEKERSPAKSSLERLMPLANMVIEEQEEIEDPMEEPLD